MCKLQGKHVKAITCKILKKADTFTVEEAWPSGLRRELRCGEARVRISEVSEKFFREKVRARMVDSGGIQSKQEGGKFFF